MADYNLAAELPSNPGPNALGHTAVIGSARRANDIPVLRDELAEQIDSLDAVNLPDDPVLPILNLE
jgi:hypothetical protein